eukprot:gene16149-22309_t
MRCQVPDGSNVAENVSKYQITNSFLLNCATMPAAFNSSETETGYGPVRRGPAPKSPEMRGSTAAFSEGNANMMDRRMSTASGYSRASQYMQDGQLLGPKRPRPHKIWKKKYVKLLIVGDSGLGKTTLIRTLMSTPGERLQDTPGYGDEIDTQATIQRMTKFIDDQNVKWLELEQSKQRKEDLDFAQSLLPIAHFPLLLPSL